MNIELRFYEELNDFLPQEWRKCSFTLELSACATLGDAIARLGVPFSEVELVLVNGQSVGFDHLLRDGDRVAVYPCFESLDVASLVRVREQPLRQPAFVAGGDLATLAGWLQRLGFDLVFRPGAASDELIAIQAAERRILLTTDPELLRRPEVTRGCLIKQNHPWKQLNAFLEKLNLL